MPRKAGDSGVLIHSGWSARRALLFNLLDRGASDLIPQFSQHRDARENAVHLLALCVGLFLLPGLRIVTE